MASRGVNKVIILGRVGQDPEVRYSPSGTAFANLTVATSEQWRDKQTGEQKELTEWHRVAVVGKLAEVVSQYVKKGDQVYSKGCYALGNGKTSQAKTATPRKSTLALMA